MDRPGTPVLAEPFSRRGATRDHPTRGPDFHALKQSRVRADASPLQFRRSAGAPFRVALTASPRPAGHSPSVPQAEPPHPGLGYGLPI